MKAYRLPEKYVQPVSPFEKMPTIQFPFEKGQNKDHLKEVSQEIFTKATPKDTVVRSSWSVPTTAYRYRGIRIPSFKEYVSLKTNILADNESKLLTMPYLWDDDEEGEQRELIDKLPLIYEIKNDFNAASDLRDEQCRFYTDSIEPFLTDIGITWDTILYWLLAPKAYLRRIDRSVPQDSHVNFSDRSTYEEEVFYRGDEKKEAKLFERRPGQWQELLRQLKEPSFGQLQTAALACAAILASCKFSPWYMARQSATMRNYVRSKTTAAEPAPDFTFRSVMCSVCHE